MPVDFLSDDQVAAYGRFVGSPSQLELERFCFLDDTDQELVGGHRGDHNRLGFSLQLVTVRALGTFLTDPLTCRRRWWTTSPSSSASPIPRA